MVPYRSLSLSPPPPCMSPWPCVCCVVVRTASPVSPPPRSTAKSSQDRPWYDSSTLVDNDFWSQPFGFPLAISRFLSLSLSHTHHTRISLPILVSFSSSHSLTQFFFSLKVCPWLPLSSPPPHTPLSVFSAFLRIFRRLHRSKSGEVCQEKKKIRRIVCWAAFLCA